jgi:hypothetical protein
VPPRGLASHLDRSRDVDADSSHQSLAIGFVDAARSLPVARHLARGTLWLGTPQSSGPLGDIQNGVVFVVEARLAGGRGCLCVDSSQVGA